MEFNFRNIFIQFLNKISKGEKNCLLSESTVGRNCKALNVKRYSVVNYEIKETCTFIRIPKECDSAKREARTSLTLGQLSW